MVEPNTTTNPSFLFLRTGLLKFLSSIISIKKTDKPIKHIVVSNDFDTKTLKNNKHAKPNSKTI